MAAAALRHSGKTTPSRSSNQSWTPNSGQVTEDGSRNPALLLASEQQQSSASILTLPQQQNQQAGTQTQSASSLGQLQKGLGQYQPARNNETPLAGDDLNSNVIVNAQLTHLISRDDAAQGQDAPTVSDVLMPDAPAVHDIATPRRIIGGRANGASLHNLPQANASVLPATCVEYDSPIARHDSSNGVVAKPTITAYVHTLSMEASDMIMNCTRSWLMIKKQFM